MTEHRLNREGIADVQRVKVIVQSRLGQLNQIIEENRQKRIKAAEKLQAKLERENELASLLDNLGGENDANRALRMMAEELQQNIDRQYTKEDLFKLNHIDESIIAFISYVRNTQLWFDKKLDGYELETLFKWLDSEHKPIIDGLNQLIEEVQNNNDAFGDKAQQREERLREQMMQEEETSSVTEDDTQLLID